MAGNENPRPAIRPIDDLPTFALEQMGSDGPGAGRPIAYAVVDRETMTWGKHALRTAAQIPSCWEEMKTLEPQGFGVGEKVVRLLRNVAIRGPALVESALVPRLDALLRPKPCTVYRVPSGCQFAFGASSGSGEM
jgi:hypothetical protein